MHEPDSPEFWSTPGIHIRLNPRIALDTSGLADFIRDELRLDSAIVLATSGTTGSGPKFVVLKQSAMLASAAAVNHHLGITRADRWLAALTLFHVGGLGIFARATLSGSDVVSVDNPLAWDKTGAEFTAAIHQNDATLSALTPVHLSDLVKHNRQSPPSLRGVLIGGGSMPPGLADKALDLGWPIWPTYGMTETCSQIATCTDPESARSGWADVLPGWQVKSEDGAFSVRGDALFSAYVTRDLSTGNWIANQPFDKDGWFETNDRMELRNDNTELSFVSRRDDLVKSLGELVSIRKLENHLSAIGVTGVIFPIPDTRRGHRFLAIVEGPAKAAVDAGNESLAPYERITQVIEIDELPRTAVGKIAKGELRSKLLT